MTDAEVAALVVRLNAVATTIKSRFAGHSKSVTDGVAALQGLAAERAILTTGKTALTAERDDLLAKVAVLEQAASGQLYRDIAYGLKNNLSSIGTMPSMVAMMKAVDDLPAV